jgi:Putative restriction endonuclease
METVAARVQQHAIEGESYASPRPAGPHILARSALGALLVPPYQFALGGGGGWWILDEPELHMSCNVLIPAVAGWRRERMPEIPTNHVFSVVPDWICEVMSPSNSRYVRLKNMPIYMSAGVAHAWFVEPEQQMIEAYKRHNDRWALTMFGEEPIARIEPFDAIEIDLTLIWGSLPS